MQEKSKRSEELRDRIIKDQKLLRDLSETISGILKGKVKLEEDETFAFVPLDYKKPIFAPEIFISEGTSPIEKIPSFGIAGPYDPDILNVLEKYRLRADDPVPIKSLREQILGNRALLKELSVGISKVLIQHGVAFETDETYAFLPVVFKKPVFTPEPVSWKTIGIRAFAVAALIEKYEILPRPLPGPLDPWLLNVLEEYRIQK
ncbi:MAG: hypothetical protein N2V75_04920 [Methanophagales archaeon]|nr:hypothetical protein [Methanophagales archaeon]